MSARSLERRVLLGLTLTFAAGIGALALSLYDTRDQLRRVTMSIQAREISAGFTLQSDPASLPKSYAGGELSYTLYSPEGQALWYSDNLQRPRRLRVPLSAEKRPLFSLPLRSGEVINVAAPLADGATLMVAKRDGLERETIGLLLQAKLRQSLALLLPVGLLALALIYAVMRWTLKPVQQAARFAQRISSDNPQPIPTANLPREMQQLAQAANQAMDKLAQALAHEKQLVADAAHELRTPLTVLDLRLQQARLEPQPDWQAIDADMGHLRQLTTQLMLLARQERGMDAVAEMARAVTPLSRVIRESVAAILPLAEAESRQMEVQIEDGVQAQGDASLLQTAIRNVLENALFHGRGTIGVAMHQQGDSIYVHVTDAGPGLNALQREQMFVRFHKGVQSSRGAGLGLAITRQILRNAGGDARFVEADCCVMELRFQRFKNRA